MTAATGILSTPTDMLADLFAASATFRACVGAGTAAIAKGFVRQNEDHSGSTPRLIVGRTSFAADQTSTTDFDTTTEYSALMHYEVESTEWNADAKHAEDVLRVAENRAGLVVSEMRTAMIANRHLYPDIVASQVVNVSGPDPEQDEGRFLVEVEFAFTVRGVME